MRLLLTGATGFVGRHAAVALAAAGHELRCLVRDRGRAAHLAEAGHELFEGDLSSTARLCDAVAGVDGVVHVAGLIAARSIAEMRDVNVAGAGRLASAAARRPEGPVRCFVLVSSLAAGGPSSTGRTEEDPAEPISDYGRSKLDGERAVRRALAGSVPLTVIRPPAVYGPHDMGIHAFFDAAARGARLALGSRPRRVSIIHGADLATAIAASVSRSGPDDRTYYVANAEAHGIDELLARIATAVGARGIRVPVPDVALRAAGVVVEEVARVRGQVPTFSRDKAREFLSDGWVCDAARARDELGWEPARGLDAGLRETAAWYREAGWIPR